MRAFHITGFLWVCLFFSCHSATGSEHPEPEQAWLASLPVDFQAQVLWVADHEEGTLYDWEYENPDNSGGGVFNTGSPEEVSASIVSENSFSGSYAVQATIKNAYRSENGKKAVRLMRWTDQPWSHGGKEFPNITYFSTWMMIPEKYDPKKQAPWDPGDGGWWNFFQFKSNDSAGESQPIWTLNIETHPDKKTMQCYAYSKVNTPKSFSFREHTLPVGQWFHIEVLVKKSTGEKSDGKIQVWINGKSVFRIDHVITCLSEDSLIWGIGNYTDHITGGDVPGTATLYFDDAMVTTVPVHSYVINPEKK